MIIFLDIDGVLCLGNTNVFNEKCLSEFENTVMDYENVNIVISSFWRKRLNLNEIKDYFNLVQNKIIGITPTLESITGYYRYNECLLYLKQHQIDNKWICIDDDERHYPQAVHLVLTDIDRGFDKSSSMLLKNLLK